MTNNKNLGKSGFALLLALLACPKNVYSKDFKVPQNNDIDITLDGKLDEEFWRDAKKIPLNYEVQPAENSSPAVATDAYIIRDNDYLYIGFDAQDKAVEAIQASFQDRDKLEDEDSVGIVLDTFNDQRRAYKFQVNPYGIQADSIQDEVLDQEDSSWNSIWSSAGLVNKDGYSVEIRIPFKILRFPTNDNLNSHKGADWSINFVRSFPRQYKYQFSYVKDNRNDSCELCQLADVSGFSSISSGNNLELTPFVSSGRNDTRVRGQDWNNGSFENEAGLDARWGVTDNSVINLTLNPDFSQVESDAIQFDANTQFALFYDEKRPFFLEGNDFFTTQLTTFYSRNIADPSYGLKYTGKEGDGSIGFMYVRDELTNIILPGTHTADLISLQEQGKPLESDALAFRYAYDVTEDSVVGASLTHRSAGDYSNTLLNFDGKHQLTESDMLRYQVIYTETEEQGQKKQGNAYRLNYKHDDRDWSWFASHNIFEQDFRADLGFLTRVGYRKSVLGGYRRWYGEKKDFWSRVQIGGDWDISYDAMGKKIEQEIESRMNFRGKYQSNLDVLIGSRDKFFVRDDMYDNTAGLGRWFGQNYWRLEYQLRPWTNLGLGFLIANSDEIDYLNTRPGETQNYAIFFDWQLGLHFNVDLSFERQVFDLIDSRTDEAFYKANAVNAKLVYQFNEKSYLRLLVRYDQVEYNPLDFIHRTQSYLKQISRQFLYAYKFDAKSVLYVGYSDGATGDDLYRSAKRDSRDVFVKFSYAFQL